MRKTVNVERRKKILLDGCRRREVRKTSTKLTSSKIKSGAKIFLAPTFPILNSKITVRFRSLFDSSPSITAFFPQHSCRSEEEKIKTVYFCRLLRIVIFLPRRKTLVRQSFPLKLKVWREKIRILSRGADEKGEKDRKRKYKS